ncbi:MAG TPA: GNAT family N-acetyltransferase [Gemmatimonadaceae bacterium]|jgi:GNAT superfamily N-acetyltransferase
MTEPDSIQPHVRLATAADVPALLPLMRGLAEYEGYADRFVITEEILLDQGFRRSPSDFECLVADRGDGTLAGILTFYFIAFTFSAKPTFYIKELYVAGDSRGAGLGEQLMRAAAAEMLRRGCAMMKWQVARWNADASRFYERLGALPNPEWVDYTLSSDMCAALDGTDMYRKTGSE